MIKKWQILMLFSCWIMFGSWSQILYSEEHGNEVKPMISKEEALRIANNDAVKIYRDLSVYEIHINIKDGDWYISYGFSDPAMVGGGPEYVISGKTGKIISYRYHQ